MDVPKINMFGDSEKEEGNSIESPIERRHTGKGNPNAILTYGSPLNNRQQKLLDKLPEDGSETIVNINEVNMPDLAALTAETGVEYAMFTKGQNRLIARGNAHRVDITPERAHLLYLEGYKWSCHTHVGFDRAILTPSEGDCVILRCFDQKVSVICNSKGDFEQFVAE